MGMTLEPETHPTGLAVVPTATLGTLEGQPVETVAGAWLLSLRAEHTRNAYRADLAEYITYLEPLGVHPLGAPRAAVDMWIDDMTTAGMAPTTVGRRISALRSFYRYAIDTGAATVNPAASVKPPTVSTDAVKAGLSLAEARAVVEAVTYNGSRAARATVGLLLGAALRVSEATAATASHIELVDGHTVLQVLGKGGRRRSIPLSPLALELLAPLPVVGYLITGPEGGACNRWQLAHLVRTAGRDAGLSRAISPHLLRHTAATVALDGGAPIQTVADLLGHSSPTTTMRYVAGRERLRDSAAYVVANAISVGA